MHWMLGSTPIAAFALPLALASACGDDDVPEHDTGAGPSTGSDDSGVTAEPSTTMSTGPSESSSGPADTSSDGSGTGDTTGTGSGSSGSSGETECPGSESSSSDESSSEGGTGPNAVGDDCSADNQCMTGVCWDFSDYDALCFGAACSGLCVSDDDCEELMTDAGAAYPDQSYCGADGRCSVVGTGFGAFACAGPSVGPATVTVRR